MCLHYPDDITRSHHKQKNIALAHSALPWMNVPRSAALQSIIVIADLITLQLPRKDKQPDKSDACSH